MFRIVARRSGERDSDAIPMNKVSMRSLSATIHEPMFFQIGNELANFARHTNNTISDPACKAVFRHAPLIRRER
jgi:hypothetical protein